MVTHAADLELVTRCLAGDRDARHLVGLRFACIGKILKVRNRRLNAPLPDEQLADVASEVVLQAWDRLADYGGYAALESWLFRFCELTLMNSLRRLGRERIGELSAEVVGVRHDGDAGRVAIDVERVHNALQRLPEEEQAVVHAKHFEALTFEEIAARMAIPLTTAKGRYYRAVGRLRQWLGSRDLEVRP